jgi:hypothetical protein
VPIFLKRQCDRTLGAEQHVSGDGWALELNNATLTGAKQGC